MHLKKYFFYSLFLVFSSTIMAQIGGRSTYQFLNLVSSPRQAAMGGKQVTGYGQNPTEGIYNPASINIGMRNQLAVNYVNYIGDINYGSAAYAFSWKESQNVLHAGVTYVNYGQFDGFDEFGNATGEFSGGEVALSLGYAMQIPNSDFYAGTNLKLISSKLEQYTSLGGALDFGLMYYKEDTGFNAALAIRNVGTQFTTYAGVQEDLPLEIALGVSKLLQNVPIRWSFTLENLQVWNIAFGNPVRDQEGLDGEIAQKDDPGFFNNFLRHMVFGAEFFPERNFNIRLGYNFRRGEELRIVDQRTFAGISGGIALKIKKLRFSYTYARYNAAASSSFFGLNIDLQ